MELKKYLTERKSFIDNLLCDFLPKKPLYGIELYNAAYYSLTTGGKRLRPILSLAGCEIISDDYKDALTPAVALEMIHTYSLIHDDLPAMDNDELRRGKPTTWKKFNEATAILAGDALLNRAFEILADWDFNSDIKIKVISEISKAAGMLGMVLGQQCDMEAEGRSDVSLEELKYIHKHKTGALITASVVSGAIVAGGEDYMIEALKNYGEKIGYAFQIVDDILDVVGDEKKLGKKVGSDAENKKVTFVTVFGIDGAEKEAEKAVKEAISSLRIFDENKREPLEAIARFIVEREY